MLSKNLRNIKNIKELEKLESLLSSISQPNVRDNTDLKKVKCYLFFKGRFITSYKI